MSISDVDFIPPHEIFITPKFSLPMEFLEPHQIPFLDILRCQKETWNLFIYSVRLARSHL